MSSRCSHIYVHKGDDYTHIYSETSNEDILYLEKTQTSESKVKLSLLEMGMIAKCFDILELERQANLTDEQILQFVKSDLQKNRTNPWSKMYYQSLCQSTEPTDDEIVEAQYKYYKSLHIKVVALRDALNSESKIYKRQFGLEQIK